LNHLAPYRAKSYDALTATIGSLDVFEVPNLGDRPYQIEVQVMWDDKPDGAILVMGGIDDGGWSAFAPITESFLVDPTGAFVCEDSQTEAT
jgi:hypothetical protein